MAKMRCHHLDLSRLAASRICQAACITSAGADEAQGPQAVMNFVRQLT
jgi:hypothetical protein